MGTSRTGWDMGASEKRTLGPKVGGWLAVSLTDSLWALGTHLARSPWTF